MKYLACFWQDTARIRCNMLVRVILGVARVALGLLVVWLSKYFIDDVIRSGSDADVMRVALLLLLAVFGGVVLRQVYSYLETAAKIRKTNEIRLDLFGNLFKRRLYSGKDFLSGDVTSRLSKDIEQFSDTVASVIPEMIVTGVQLVCAFLLLRWFDARLAWVLVAVSAVAMAFGKLVVRKLRNMSLAIREKESRIQMRVQEGVEHNALLRSLGSEDWMTDGLDNMQRLLKDDVLRRTRFTIIARLVIGSAFSLGYMLAFVWGGVGLRNGVITFGVMTSFLQLVMQIQHPILMLLNSAPQLIHATASIDRLEELRTDSAEVQDEKNLPVFERAGVRIDNVSFGYDSCNRKIFDAFSKEFAPSSKTAIMGETGIGKTTLFRMLLGLVKPETGTLKIYSEDNEFEISSQVRKNFVFVPQGNSLLSGTIRFNLQLAKPDASDGELLQTLHIACADFVNDLPQGLDTELGERGTRLSEGQAQRIAIARGLLRPGSVLLLDEISSSLDEATERELFCRIFAAFPKKTMLFITHRSGVCELCENVLRLD